MAGEAHHLHGTPDFSRVQHYSSSGDRECEKRSNIVTFSPANISRGQHDTSSFRHEVPVAEVRDERPGLRERSLERWKRVSLTGVLSAALLISITGFLGRVGFSTGDDEPPAAAVLSQSGLFLEKTTSLAPAAHAAQAMWKKTVGDFYGDQLMSNQHALQAPVQHVRVNFGHGSELDTNPFGVSESDELHGKLLPEAQAEEDNWNMKLHSMQQDELKSNQDVMNNVILLHSQPVQSTDPADIDAELRARSSARAEQKHRALVRLAMLTINPSTQTNLPAHKHHLASSAASAATAEQRQEVLSAAAVPQQQQAVVPQQQDVTVQNHTARMEAQRPAAAPAPSPAPAALVSRATATATASVAQQQLAAAAPAVAQHQQFMKHGSTSEESRSALSSFFDSLVVRDEHKTALHIAQYKAPVAQLQQTIVPMEDKMQVLKEVKKVEHQMEWLKDNLSRISSMLEHPVAPPAQQTRQAQNPPTPGTSEAPRGIAFARQLAVQNEAAKTPIYAPPPAGCPIWPAQGETLPIHCPHQLSALGQEEGVLGREKLSARQPSECPDGSVRFVCEHEEKLERAGEQW